MAKRKLAPPNYTQIPNRILDFQHRFKNPHLRVILCVCRETFGFHRKTANLSISQISKKTGLSRATACRAINSLCSFGYLSRRQHKRSYLYFIDLKRTSLPS